MPYPFDPTGKAVTNLISEQRTLTAPAPSKEHFIIVNEGPFFEDSLVVTIVSSGRVLENGVDYIPTIQFDEASLRCAKPIYGAISFHDHTLIGDVSLQYQTLGDVYTIDATIAASIYTPDIAPRTTNWETLVTVDPIFKRVIHEWDLINMYNRDALIAAIAEVVLAIAARSQASIADILRQPYLTTPAQGAIIETRLPMIVGNPFYTMYMTTFVQRDFQITEEIDVDFLTPIEKSVMLIPNVDTGDSKDYMLSDVILSPNTTYLVRTRDVDNLGNVSDWSKPVRFTTQYTYIEKPIPTSPLNGEYVVGNILTLDSGSFVVGVDDPQRPHDDTHVASLFTLYASDGTTILEQKEVSSASTTFDLTSYLSGPQNTFYWKVRQKGAVNGYSQESDLLMVKHHVEFDVWTLEDPIVAGDFDTLTKLDRSTMGSLATRSLWISSAYVTDIKVIEAITNFLWIGYGDTISPKLKQFDLNDTGTTPVQDLSVIGMNTGDIADSGQYFYYRYGTNTIKRFNISLGYNDQSRNASGTTVKVDAGPDGHLYLYVATADLISKINIFNRELTSTEVDYSVLTGLISDMYYDADLDVLFYVTDANIVSRASITIPTLTVDEDYDFSAIATSIGSGTITELVDGKNGYLYGTDGTYLFRFDKSNLSVGMIYANPSIAGIKSLAVGVDGYLYFIGDSIAAYRADATDLTVVSSYPGGAKALTKLVLIDRW